MCLYRASTTTINKVGAIWIYFRKWLKWVKMLKILLDKC